MITYYLHPYSVRLAGKQLRVYPTNLRLPIWARGLHLEVALSRFKTHLSEIKIIEPGELLDRVRSHLSLPRDLPFRLVRPTLDPGEVVEELRARIKPDGSEIVEWMIIEAAQNIVLRSREEEYSRAGSQLLTNTGDAFIPGVSLEEFRFKQELGEVVRRRGWGTLLTNIRDLRVPHRGKIVAIFKDILAAASIPYAHRFQYGGLIAKWKELAQTPITNAVGFIRDIAGNVFPHFFNQVPRRPKMRARVILRFFSNVDQRVTMRFRQLYDYRQVLSEHSFNIEAGFSQVEFEVSSFPYVPPVVSEIQPEDNTNTVLTYYDVQ